MILETKEITLSSCIISLDKDNIVLMKMKDNLETNKASAIEIVASILEISNKTPFYLIVDATNIFGSMDKGANHYFATEPEYNRLRIATAVIVNSLPIRMLINFYQTVHLGKDKNLKIVKNKEEALAYFKSLN